MQLEISDKERAQVATDLKDVSQLVGEAELAIMTVDVLAQRAGFDLSPVKGKLDAASEFLTKAQERNRGMSAILYRTRVAGTLEPKTKTSELADLAAISGDDARELLALLERAQAVAERIDAKRGFTVDEKMPLNPGESRGTDLAEDVSVLALRVRRGVHGATGKGLE